MAVMPQPPQRLPPPTNLMRITTVLVMLVIIAKPYSISIISTIQIANALPAVMLLQKYEAVLQSLLVAKLALRGRIAQMVFKNLTVQQVHIQV